MPLEPPAAGSPCATARAPISVRLNASTVLMSGSGAPCLTATPTPTRARSTRLPAAILPMRIISSIAAGVITAISNASPSRMRRDRAPAVALSTVTLCSVRFSKSGITESTTSFIAPVVSTLISAAAVVRTSPASMTIATAPTIPLLMIVSLLDPAGRVRYRPGERRAPGAEAFVGILPFSDVFKPAIHGELAHIGNGVVDQRLRPVFLRLVAVPVHDLLERPAVARGQTLLRHADRKGADGARSRGIAEELAQAVVCGVLAAAGEPGGGEPNGGDSELDVLHRRADRGEQDALVVLGVFAFPLGRRGFREGCLPALVGQHHHAGDGVSHVGLLHRGKALGMIDQPVGLGQENIEHPLAHGRVVDDQDIEALRVGAGRRP